MAINVLPPTLSKSKQPTPTPPPAMNKRLPPLADRSSLSYRLTNLSKQKLAREATAPDPDIRRCLVHFRMHCRSVEWTQQEMATKITSFEFEDDSESESEDEDHAQAEQQQQMILESIARNAASSAASKTDQAEGVEVEVEVEAKEIPSTPSSESSSSSTKDTEQIHVHFEIASPVSSEENKDAGIVDKGRRCLEKAQKPTGFWPSPAQCMPVRITG